MISFLFHGHYLFCWIALIIILFSFLVSFTEQQFPREEQIDNLCSPVASMLYLSMDPAIYYAVFPFAFQML